MKTPQSEIQVPIGRDIPKEQAQEEIKAFFASKGDKLAYVDDIMEALDLKYEVVAEICRELEESGEIKEVKIEYDIHTKVAAILRTEDADLLKRLVDIFFEKYYDPEPLSPGELAAIKEADEARKRGDKDYFIPWKEVKKELDL
ncbi:MAG: hypothetical protein ACOZF2_03270 [Thermodesulfobacteriota bacterium]